MYKNNIGEFRHHLQDHDGINLRIFQYHFHIFRKYNSINFDTFIILYLHFHIFPFPPPTMASPNAHAQRILLLRARAVDTNTFSPNKGNPSLKRLPFASARRVFVRLHLVHQYLDNTKPAKITSQCSTHDFGSNVFLDAASVVTFYWIL